MIYFKTLTFKNILSAGNQPVTIDLNTNKTTLIHGVNGSGKSTVLDALTYVLFGKSFRGVNLTQLLNTQNKKGLLVEVEFSIGKDIFLVRRGMKPRVFETFKNKEIIDPKANDRDNQQYLEQNILKLSFKSFTQIVILGASNFIPFMQLVPGARRECVEDFLDIKVFSTMAVLAKERLRGMKEQLSMLEKDISTHEFRLETQQDKIRFMVKSDDGQIEQLKAKIRDAEVQVLECELIMKQWVGDLQKQSELIDEARAKDPHKQVRQLNNVLIKLNTKLERLVKEKNFFDQDDCPTCGQHIEFALKTAAQGNIQREIEEVDKASVQASGMLTKQNDLVDYLTDLQTTMQSFKNQAFEVETRLKAQRKIIKDSQVEIDNIQNDTASVDLEEGKLLEMERELFELKNKKRELQEKVNNLDLVAGLLKDSGIKTQIVKKYLPAMNKYIRYYLNELDFPIHFSLDNEFSESVQSPLHQDFSYSSFSEGQKGRIDLALMLMWREIGRLKNSVTTNLLILDEVFSSSLDDTGKECLLQLLRYRLPDNQNILVVDHTLSGAFREKFDANIEVSRVGGFSRYARA